LRGAASSGFNSGIASPIVGSLGAQLPRSEPASGFRTGSNSGDEQSGRTSPEHIEVDMEDLSRVPSYQTAVRTPIRSNSRTEAGVLPDYLTALSAPRTPPTTDNPTDPLSTIREGVPSSYHITDSARPALTPSNRTSSEDIYMR
jgi:hypothetical protein